MHIDLFTYWPQTIKNQVPFWFRMQEATLKKLLGHFSKDLSKNRASVALLDCVNLGFVYPEWSLTIAVICDMSRK